MPLPEFIDSDWVKEVTIRRSLGKLWIDWVIDDAKVAIAHNPNLDYLQAGSFDLGVTNWLTGVSTRGKSLIIDGRITPNPLIWLYSQVIPYLLF